MKGTHNENKKIEIYINETCEPLDKRLYNLQKQIENIDKQLQKSAFEDKHIITRIRQHTDPKSFNRRQRSASGLNNAAQKYLSDHNSCHFYDANEHNLQGELDFLNAMISPISSVSTMRRTEATTNPATILTSEHDGDVQQRW